MSKSSDVFALAIQDAEDMLGYFNMLKIKKGARLGFPPEFSPAAGRQYANNSLLPGGSDRKSSPPASMIRREATYRLPIGT